MTSDPSAVNVQQISTANCTKFRSKSQDTWVLRPAITGKWCVGEDTPVRMGLNLSWWFPKLRIQGGQTNKNISQSAYKYHFSEVFEWVQPWFQPPFHAASPGYFSFQPGSCSCHSQREGTGASMGLPNPFRCCQLKQGVWPTWCGKPQLTHPELWNPKLKVFFVYQISGELGPSWDCLCGAIDIWKHPPYPPGTLRGCVAKVGTRCGNPTRLWVKTPVAHWTK